MIGLRNSRVVSRGASAAWLAVVYLVALSALHNGRPNLGLQGLSSRTVSAPTQAVSNAYARLPLAFEAAPSQNDSQANFVAHGNGYTIFIKPAETILAMRASRGTGTLSMKFVGANENASLTASEELPGKSNYILGNDPRKWRVNVPTYRKVIRRSLYPGIDLVYYGTQRNLEYDLVVAPQANPNAVRLAFDGIEKVGTDTQGDLLATILGNELRLHKPTAYQEINGERHLVAANYVFKNARSVGLQLGQYDSREPLIIDPVLSDSSVLGGSNIDGANAIAVAPDGTAFIAGGTFSSDFPTANALQPNAGGPNDFPQDAFVSKISADGSTLIYSTYLGGENADVANGIAVDALGEAYVTGTTLSPHFPITPGSWNTLCGDDGKCGATWNPQGLIVSNAFVTKLNVAGSGLVYSTFLGYYENVRGQSIAVDDNENAYVTGQVESNGTPTVTVTAPNQPPLPFIPIGLQTAAFQGTFGGGTDSFVAKLSATGNSLLYESYLGGSNEEIGYGIAADNSGVAYVTGLTYSTDFPLAGISIQNTAGGAGDGFVAAVNTNGSGPSSLLFSTYIGGAGLDQGNAIALDSVGGSGNIYVVGTTNSAMIPATAPFTSPRPFGGEDDAFVLKLTPTGGLTYFTYLGGSLADAGLGVAADSSGNAYVTGSTVSPDFPISGAVFQKTFGGGNADAFVTKLDPTGATLLYSTYLGGTNTDVANGIAVDTSGSAYVAGQTCSTDFPLSNPISTAGPLGNCDAFVSKISTQGGLAANPSGLSFQAQSLGTASPAQTITITNTNDSASVTISSITSSSAEFIETNTCSAPISAGATCAISVQFKPTASGIQKGAITIASNATNPTLVVSLTGASSTLSLSASSLSFGNQLVGVQSAQQAVTVTNNSSGSITISSIAASGDFAETNSCTNSPLPAGTNCAINVTYKPSAIGAGVGAVTITDTAPGSPQSILVTGTGILPTPTVTVTPTSLSFGTQAIGVASSPQTVTVTNSGTGTLTVSGITASGDFSETDSCGAPLPAGTNCVINVTYKPSGAGAGVGAISISDNAAASPQTVHLSGTGASSGFSISSPITNATVPAGQTATYTLTVTPVAGFSQPVAFTCNNLPRDATCSFAPNPLTMTGSAPATVTISIATGLRTLVPSPIQKIDPPGTFLRMGIPWIVAALMILILAAFWRRRRPALAAFGLTAALLILAAGCGSGNQSGVPAGTPAGTYQVTVAGTAGSLTNTLTLNLQVN